MPSDPQTLITLVIGASVFVLVLSLWVLVVLFWSMRRTRKTQKIGERLGIKSVYRSGTRTVHLWREGERADAVVPDVRRSKSLWTGFDESCRRAGWTAGAGPVLMLLLGAILICGVFVGVLTSNAIVGIGVALAVAVLFRILMGGRIAQREAVFERQLVDAMELASRSLRAGHPLLGAFHLISEEMAAPVKNVFGDLCQRHELGASLEDSLREVAEDTTSADMRMFATAVAIQMRTGGNLAELIERLSVVIRDRMRLNRRVRVLTAQTQFSKRILLALPFIMFLILNVLNPRYMSPLYETTPGHMLIAVGIAGLALGAWTMHRLSILKY